MSVLSIEFTIPLIFMAVIITIETVLIWVLFIKFKRLQSYNNCFLLSLSVSDFMIGSVCTILYIYLQQNAKGYFTAISLFANLFNILSLAIERHYAVTRPFRYKVHIRKIMHILISSTWVLAVGVNLIPLAWNTDQSTDQHKIYLVCHLMVPVLVFCVIILLYVRILQTVKKRNAIFAQNAAQNPSPHSLVEKQRLLNEWKITKVIILITVLFTAAWLPILYMTICVISGYAKYIPRDLSKWAMVTLVLHCLINPLIYSFMKSDIRDVIMKGLRCFVSMPRPQRGHFSPSTVEMNELNE